MKTKLFSTFVGVITAASLVLGGTSYAAGAAAFSLSPASGTENVNSTFSVGIYENGSSVNVVTANFSYDTSKLQLVNVDTSASAFGSDAGSTSTSISRYVPAGGTVSGNAEIAVVNFKAIAGSGSAAVTVGTSGSHIASGGTEQWNGASVSGNYTMNTPVATPPTPPAPTPTPGSTGSGSNTGANSSTATSTNKAKATTTTGTVAGASTTQTTTPATSTTPLASNSQKTTATPATAKLQTTNHKSHTMAWCLSILLVVIALGGGFYLMKRRSPVVAPVATPKPKTTQKKTTAARKKTPAKRVAKKI